VCLCGKKNTSEYIYIPDFFVALYPNILVEKFVLIATTGKNAKPLIIPHYNQPIF